MKHFNAGIMIVLIMLMAGCNLFAAESENEAYQKRCDYYGCTFARYNDYYSFIQAKRLPRHDWEKPDVPEQRHIDFMQNEFVPFCNTTNDLTEISKFIQSHETRFSVIRYNSPKPIPTVTDQDNARIVLDDASRIFRESKKFGCPIVVDEVPLNIDESSTCVELGQPDYNRLEKIASKLSKIRTQKDSDFDSILRHIALVRVGTSEGLSFRCIKFRDACITLFDQGYVRPSSVPQVKLSIHADETIARDEDDQSVDACIDSADSMEVIHEQRIPSPKLHGSRRWWWGGFFAGLGFSGSIGCAAYFLRAYQNGIRIASGCASVAACMAFLFARHKLTQECGIRYEASLRGMRYGAGASVVASAGLFFAHDSPAVQKLVALAARMK